MDKSENGLSNLLANRMPSLNSLSSNLQQLGSGLANNGANNINNAALMNAFNFAGLGLWDNQLVSAMSQYLDINNSLLNLKQETSPTTDNGQQQQQTLKRTDDDDNLENGCNRDVLDLKINNNKRFKVSNNGYVQQHNNEITTQLNHNKTSKDQLNFLDNGRSFPCHECHKTFATEVDLKMHLLRHVMQHPFSCSTCGKGFKYEHTLQFHEKQHGVDLNNKLNLKNSTKKSSTNSSNQQPNNHQRTDLLDEKSLFGNSGSRKTKYTSSSTTTSKQLLHHLNDDEEDNIPNNLLAVTNNSLTTKLNNNNNNLTSKCTPPNSSLFSSLSNSNSSAFDLGLSNLGSSMPNLGIQMKSEKVLIVMVEGVNPLNDQTYTLYKCNICGFAFANLAPVTEHILTLHSNNQKFNCDKCGANFKRRNELLLHDQIHKAMEQQANSKLIMMQYLNANDPNKLDSNNNDNLLLNSNNLNGAAHHLNGEVDNLIGLNLTKTQRKDSESSQESLNLTVKTKNGQTKELRNDELDELSKNIAVVKENVTNDLGEIEEIVPGQFKCRYCDKTFDRVFSVHRHERVHTGFKPCVCKVCGKGFSEKRNLRHHLIRFHSDGSGRELLRRVRKDKSMNSEENNEAKRQLKAMEMNILSINNNSFQSNTGSDEDHDLPSVNSFNNNSSNNLKDKQTDHEDNSSNHSAETNSMNNKATSSRRRKSVKPYKVNQPKNENIVEQQQDTEEDEKDDNSSSDQTSFKEAMDDEDSNNDGSNNDE